MYKILLFVKRKAGLTRAEFIDYYETRHVPLVLGDDGERLAKLIGAPATARPSLFSTTGVIRSVPLTSS